MWPDGSAFARGTTPADRSFRMSGISRSKNDPGAQAHAQRFVVEGVTAKGGVPRVVSVDVHHGDVVRLRPCIDCTVMGIQQLLDLCVAQRPEKASR